MAIEDITKSKEFKKLVKTFRTKEGLSLKEAKAKALKQLSSVKPGEQADPVEPKATEGEDTKSPEPKGKLTALEKKLLADNAALKKQNIALAQIPGIKFGPVRKNIPAVVKLGPRIPVDRSKGQYWKLPAKPK